MRRCPTRPAATSATGWPPRSRRASPRSSWGSTPTPRACGPSARRRATRATGSAAERAAEAVVAHCEAAIEAVADGLRGGQAPARLLRAARRRRAGGRSSASPAAPRPTACWSSPTPSAATSTSRPPPTPRRSSARPRRRGARSTAWPPTRSRSAPTSGPTRSSRSSTAARERGRGVFVLVRTSNPGGAFLQDAELAEGGVVWERMAGVVAGARRRRARSPTSAPSPAPPCPSTSSACASSCPRAPFLLPGIGAQGGSVADVAPAFAPGRAGGLVTSSRGHRPRPRAARRRSGPAPPAPRPSACASRPGRSRAEPRARAVAPRRNAGASGAVSSAGHALPQPRPLAGPARPSRGRSRRSCSSCISADRAARSADTAYQRAGITGSTTTGDTGTTTRHDHDRGAEAAALLRGQGRRRALGDRRQDRRAARATSSGSTPTSTRRRCTPGSASSSAREARRSSRSSPSRRARCAAAPAAAAAPPSISAPAAFLFQPDTRDVVFARDAQDRRPIASTTKLMTALVALDELDLRKHLHAAAPTRRRRRVGGRPARRRAHDLRRPAAGDDAAVGQRRGQRRGGPQRRVGRRVRAPDERAGARARPAQHRTSPTRSASTRPGNYSSRRGPGQDGAAAAAQQLRPRDHRPAAGHAALGRARARGRQPQRPRGRYPFVDGVKTGHTLGAGYVLVGSAPPQRRRGGQRGARRAERGRARRRQPRAAALRAVPLPSASLPYAPGRCSGRSPVADRATRPRRAGRPPTLRVVARRGRAAAHPGRRRARAASRARSPRARGWAPWRSCAAARWSARTAARRRAAPCPTAERSPSACASWSSRTGTLVLLAFLAACTVLLVLLRRRVVAGSQGRGAAGAPVIITVTLNAAIDKSLSVPNFRLGRRHRTVEQTTMPGGKGVNVARTLKTLGQPVIATGLRRRPDRHAHRRAAHRRVDPQRLRAHPRGVAHQHRGLRPDQRRADRDQRARPGGHAPTRSSCSATSCSTWPAAPTSSSSPARCRAASRPTSTRR